MYSYFGRVFFLNLKAYKTSIGGESWQKQRQQKISAAAEKAVETEPARRKEIVEVKGDVKFIELDFEN